MKNVIKFIVHVYSKEAVVSDTYTMTQGKWLYRVKTKISAETWVIK